MSHSLAAMLYVPGSDERKLAKIEQLDGSAYILDLEDAVAPQAKAAARRLVAATLQRGSSRAELWVRVNPGASGLLVDDLEAVVVPGLDGIILPKVESAADVATADALLGALERSRGMTLGSVSLIATIETAAGLGRVDEIAGASPRIACLGFGAGDFSLDLGLDWPPEGGLGHTLLTAKAELVLASRRNGLGAPHDGVFPDFRAPEQLRAEAQAAAGAGFRRQARDPPRSAAGDRGGVRGRAPSRSPRRRPWSTPTRRGSARGGGGVHIDGRFIDAPVAERARRVLDSQPTAVRRSRTALDRPRAHCLHARCLHAHACARLLGQVAPSPVALEGIRVLDMSSLYAAPLIAMNLGDFGADVIKVEHPARRRRPSLGAGQGRSPAVVEDDLAEQAGDRARSQPGGGSRCRARARRAGRRGDRELPAGQARALGPVSGGAARSQPSAW